MLCSEELIQDEWVLNDMTSHMSHMGEGIRLSSQVVTFYLFDYLVYFLNVNMLSLLSGQGYPCDSHIFANYK